MLSLTKTSSSRNRQQGSSLLEVLISILLMSFGMLALAGMQAYSVAAQKNAANRAIASALATELAEVIRLNPTGLSAGNYDVAMMTTGAPPALAPCAFPNCTTPALLAAADLTAFQSRVRALLPQGGVELARPRCQRDPGQHLDHLGRSRRTRQHPESRGRRPVRRIDGR
jgi:type IV pilus assembly protein PilV